MTNLNSPHPTKTQTLAMLKELAESLMSLRDRRATNGKPTDLVRWQVGKVQMARLMVENYWPDPAGTQIELKPPPDAPLNA